MHYACEWRHVDVNLYGCDVYVARRPIALPPHSLALFSVCVDIKAPRTKGVPIPIYIAFDFDEIEMRCVRIRRSTIRLSRSLRASGWSEALRISLRGHRRVMSPEVKNDGVYDDGPMNILCMYVYMEEPAE